MSTTLRSLLVLTLPVLAALAASESRSETPLLDVHVAPSGTRWHLERVDGATLTVEPHGGTAREPYRFTLPPEAAGARIRSARVGTQPTADGGERPVLALDVARGETSAIHFAVPSGPERTWHLSEPIVKTAGEPFRIAELRGVGTDSLDMTLRRGWLSPHAGCEKPELLVFTDSCEALKMFALLDVGNGRRIPIGSTL